MAIWTITTHHGTCLAVDRQSGTLCHGIDAAKTDQVFTCTSSEDDGFALLLSRSVMACPGGAAIGRVLSYRIAVRDGMPGFIVPATGLLLTAAPDGTVSADRHEQGGWEMFHLLPANGMELGAGIAALQDLRGGADFFVRYARSDGCDVAVLQALARLLDPSDARVVARRISDLALYAELFQVLRRHVAGSRRPFEWLTTERLAWGIAAHGWSIGAHTYGAPEVIDGQHGELRIGRYTSIAGQVQIVVANHATTSLTSYPFAALADFWPGADPDVADHVGRGVVIGSDVWIGTGACILPGARIGDGAVIGARAVVAGNVPPYAVVVGNTARVVRKRFSDAQIVQLLAMQWWCWPEHIVDRHLPLLLGENVDALLAVAESPDATQRSE